ASVNKQPGSTVLFRLQGWTSSRVESYGRVSAEGMGVRFAVIVRSQAGNRIFPARRVSERPQRIATGIFGFFSFLVIGFAETFDRPKDQRTAVIENINCARGQAVLRQFDFYSHAIPFDPSVE